MTPENDPERALASLQLGHEWLYMWAKEELALLPPSTWITVALTMIEVVINNSDPTPEVRDSIAFNLIREIEERLMSRQMNGPDS